ncbi:conjugal transfer protein TraF [Ideonella livida]|uniref:Conjugal transfer protein TraF n=1 Tax=Ideonella livida TaxID=2707176 RepID=A0A7C9TN14_9BURK|nr:conjugal transfer protein TraF [Ideonella livida]NDY93065.1 conjugal transfer protein TraF [Ideonella livida]
MLNAAALVAGALAALPAQANQSLSITGYGLTVGPVFNRSNLGSVAFNPANAVRLVGDDEKWRFGVGQVGGRYEIGDASDVAGMVDQVTADIELAQTSDSASVAKTLATNINSVYVPALERGAVLSAQAQLSAGAPILFKSTETLPGVWSFNLNAQLQMRGTFRGADVGVLTRFSAPGASFDGQAMQVSLVSLADQLVTLQQAISNANTLEAAAAQASALQSLLDAQFASLPQADKDLLGAVVDYTKAGNKVGASFALRTSSAFDFKLAEVNQISAGYATDVSGWLSPTLREWAPSAKLDAGLRVNVYQANLYRQVVAFVDESGNANEVEINRNDAYLKQATALGLDLGLMWGDDHYQLGASLYNLNRPKFHYPNPAEDPNVANRAAAMALSGQGKLNLRDTVELKPHVVLEGSVFSQNKRWLLQGSVALSETNDFVGDPQKVYSVSASYNAERFETAWQEWLVPSVRLGLRQNMVGSKLSTIGLGFTWGVFSLDLNASTQRVKADGNQIPRSAGLSLAIAERF